MRSAWCPRHCVQLLFVHVDRHGLNGRPKHPFSDSYHVGRDRKSRGAAALGYTYTEQFVLACVFLPPEGDTTAWMQEVEQRRKQMPRMGGELERVGA